VNLLRRLEGKGFERLSRKRHLIALELSLTDPEFRLWSLLVSLYAWFEGDQETYGKVVATNRYLASMLPKSEWSATKVNRNLKALLQKGLITRVGRSEYKDNASVTQQKDSPVKQIVSPTEQVVSSIKQDWPQKEKFPFNSSKASTSLRTDEEYEELAKEFPTLGIDSLKWADENIKDYNN